MSPLMTFQLLLLLVASFAYAAPRPQASTPTTTGSYWMSSIERKGNVAFGNDTSYQVFRDVQKDFGAKGDGVTDDTVAINNAISSGNRCGLGCDSSTVTPALVYFPPGTYLVSAPIVQYYYTQLVGDALSIPTIKATSGFLGIAIIDTDPYIPGQNGAQWYTNQNNFFRQIRNFIIDSTSMPVTSSVAGIHWQVAQATSLQNITFNMIEDQSDQNAQQGIFMDNGSGGFMSDLTFNGGGFGAFFGNQQFTTRNLVFNNCRTAIYMNWNWLWTFKSITINNAKIGIDMSGLENHVNQTVGSVVLLDSVMTGTDIGIKTSFNSTSVPSTAGTLVISQVDFTDTQVAIVGADGTTPILAGGAVINSWAQGNTYLPSTGSKKVKRVPQLSSSSSADTCGEPAMSTLTATVSALPGTMASSSSSSAANSVSTSPANTTSTGSFPNVTGYSNTSSTSSTCSATPSEVSLKSHTQQQLTPPAMPPPLMGSDGVFQRSKPQYEDTPVTSFVHIKDFNAAGDGITDDTNAIQTAMNSTTTDQILYFDHGAYLITDTILVPANIRITGEIWPLIMISGAKFSSATNPIPAFQVGNPGDQGNVEMTDLIFETQGIAPGAIMMEWNVQELSQGSCGLWDVHFRVGGSAGTELQADTCVGNTTDSQSYNPDCAGSFLMLHITQQATAYLENVWLWVSDHELDIAPHAEVNVYNGRGMLIESQGPVWLYGTSVEHSQLYNYQVSNAKNIFMGAIQTETAYMQPSPDALHAGFGPDTAFTDPTFTNCASDDENCIRTWGLRVVDSSEIYVYGAGLYSFFEDYKQQCLDTESCQANMVDIQCSSSVYLYGLSTKAATNMVSVNGQSQALQSDNTNGFCQTIALFEAQ